jgi:hypothetical protein
MDQTSMISESTTVVEASEMLAAAGLEITGLRLVRGRWYADLAVRAAQRDDSLPCQRAEGSGETPAAALEDARLGWVRYVDHVARMRRAGAATA